jgi:protein-S-isoprenylcysteine O-methyltransferase Ste14
MRELIFRFTSLPAYDIGALVVVLLYALQAEVRFGSRARTMRPGPSDRNSTMAVSLSSAVPVLGLVLTVKANSPGLSSCIPAWFRLATLPGLPGIAWFGVALGVCGLALRLWAVMTLRERYTRTLLIQDHHPIESNGPYRWVRHPGYLGSLLCFAGVALASANLIVLIASIAATFAAYSYRIKVEDQMLIAALGPPYAEYRKHVGALLPSLGAKRLSGSSPRNI